METSIGLDGTDRALLYEVKVLEFQDGMQEMYQMDRQDTIYPRPAIGREEICGQYLVGT